MIMVLWRFSVAYLLAASRGLSFGSRTEINLFSLDKRVNGACRGFRCHVPRARMHAHTSTASILHDHSTYGL
uniref:Putative secreted protein n=1 Tax=Anopheles darlingi TaxID=43151 RepID=A0A2M4DI53_ANODA